MQKYLTPENVTAACLAGVVLIMFLACVEQWMF